jgi:hypothetical protein
MAICCGCPDSSFPFFIQVSQYGPDHYWVFDTGNNADITTAFATGLYLNAKYTLQSLCPSHRSPFFGNGLVGLIG